MPNIKNSTQEKVNIASIVNGIVVTKQGQLRKILKIQPVNFALKSSEDKDIIIGEYQNFLNSLHFPLQIIVQSRKLDVSPYLLMLQKKVVSEPNELLRLHAFEYIDFIERLTQVTNIMDKKFYAVVAYDPPDLIKKGLFSSIFGGRVSKVSFSQSQWQKYVKELNQRVMTVSEGLSQIGVRVKELKTQEVIELFYGLYNPEEATAEKLTEISRLQAPVISIQNSPDQNLSSSPQKQVDNKAEILNGQANGAAAAAEQTAAPNQAAPPTDVNEAPQPSGKGANSNLSGSSTKN